MTVLSFLANYWKEALAILIVGGAIFYVLGLRSDNQRLTQDLQVSQALTESLSIQLVENHQALKNRTEMVQQLSKEKAQTKELLEKIYEDNEEACKWSVGRIPDAILGQLCQ
jgi:predicted metallo-beta-lactamase superfamily hydrolase